MVTVTIETNQVPDIEDIIVINGNRMGEEVNKDNLDRIVNFEHQVKIRIVDRLTELIVQKAHLLKAKIHHLLQGQTHHQANQDLHLVPNQERVAVASQKSNISFYRVLEYCKCVIRDSSILHHRGLFAKMSYTYSLSFVT